MRTEDDVLCHIVERTLLHEECVLHIACWVISSEVHLCEYVKVVLYLRTVSQCEAHALENLHNLILHDRERVACAELDRVGSTGKVEVIGNSLSSCHLFLESVDLIECELLEFVNLHTKLLLLIGRHATEVGHQGVELTFLTEILQTKSLDFFCVGGCQRFHFLTK